MVVVLAAVFAISLVTMMGLSALLGGITTAPEAEALARAPVRSPTGSPSTVPVRPPPPDPLDGG